MAIELKPAMVYTDTYGDGVYAEIRTFAVIRDGVHIGKIFYNHPGRFPTGDKELEWAIRFQPDKLPYKEFDAKIKSTDVSEESIRVAIQRVIYDLVNEYDMALTKFNGYSNPVKWFLTH